VRINRVVLTSFHLAQQMLRDLQQRCINRVVLTSFHLAQQMLRDLQQRFFVTLQPFRFVVFNAALRSGQIMPGVKISKSIADESATEVRGGRGGNKTPRVVDDVRLAAGKGWPVDDTVHEGWWERDTSAASGGPVMRHPAPKQLVAIGDVHGDVSALRRAFAVAGAVDTHGRWAGGSMVVVQMGDNLDRGKDEIAVLRLLQRLRREAAAAGGAVHVVLGNHELQNVAGDFRSVASNTGFTSLPVNLTAIGTYVAGLRPGHDVS
jgi:hypothetical protein